MNALWPNDSLTFVWDILKLHAKLNKFSKRFFLIQWLVYKVTKLLIWTKWVLSFHFYEKFWICIPIWITFVKEVFLIWWLVYKVNDCFMTKWLPYPHFLWDIFKLYTKLNFCERSFFILWLVKKVTNQAQLGVPHSEIQVELDWQPKW